VEFDNSFEVPLPPAEAWIVLTDIRRIAPCMPGAELTDVVNDSTYKGKISVRLGPVALAFAGAVAFEEMDAVNHKARMKAQGSDAKGRGSAHATAAFRLEPAGSGTKVLVHTDLALSGAVAQYGRGVGVIQATAAAIMGQFAKNLGQMLAQQVDRAAAATIPSAPPSGTPSAAAAGIAPVAEASDSSLAASPALSAGPPSAPPAAAKPISGFSLMANVLWQAIVRLFRGRSA
jgi:carbon monoxide dehydrogenase subunit G